MKKLRMTGLLLILLFIPLQGISNTIKIPEDYATIQDGLNMASKDYTVLVAPGIYKENIIWPEKDGIKLIGSGENITIIDGTQKGCVILFDFKVDIISSNTVISNLCIKNGKSDYGGGIYCNYSSPKFSDIIVMNNTANKNGGGICLFGSSPILSNISIVNNFSPEYSGGLACIYSNPTMSNINISNNSASIQAGGVSFYESFPKLFDTKISVNHSEAGAGVVCNKSSIECLNLIIDDNSASDCGGGMICIESNTEFSNISITNNKAKRIGGGIFCLNSNTIFKKVNVINNLVDYYGGGIASYNSDLKLTNVTIASNIASDEGGGLFFFNSSSIIQNSIIYYNTPQAVCFANSPQNSTTIDQLTISHSNIENGRYGMSFVNVNEHYSFHWGDGNYSTKPLFIDSYSNYNLKPDSPCIDSGHPDLDNDGISWVNDPDDQDPDGSRMDMGSHHFPQELTFTLPDQISENHGVLTGTINSNYVLEQELIVKVKSSNPSLVSVPELVVIPKGCTITTLELTIHNNQQYDTERTVIISAVFWKEYQHTLTIISDELSIKINYPENNASTDQLMGIFGEASDLLNEISKIQLKISQGDQFLDENFEFGNQLVWIDAQGTTEWFLHTSKINWKKNSIHKISALATNTEGYTALTTITYINGNLYEPSTITCDLSIDHSIAGEPIEIKGKILPPPIVSGMIVDLSLKHIESNEIVYPKPEYTNKAGEFTFQVPCGKINKAGFWEIHTSWNGDNQLESSNSKIKPLHVSQSLSRLSLYATTRHLKLDETITFSGKLSYQIDCYNGLINQTLIFKTIDPDGIEASETVLTDNLFGNYKIPDYSFNRLGKWNVQLAFSGNEGMSPCTSESIDIHVVETAGYAIIVQGKIKNSEGLKAHNKTTQSVYRQLKKRGFFVDETTNTDDIMYLNYDLSQSGVDGIPTKKSVKSAITQWAKEKMDQKPANLYIIMVDHGLEDEFFIDPDIITSSELAQWLKTLQENLVNDDAKIQEIIVVLGFCKSGSFIDELSGDQRVIITSASANEFSYKGPKETDHSGNLLRDGEYFVTELFKKFSFGHSVRESFEKAALLTKRYTLSPSGMPNSPFFDNSLQHPLIDDNGDKQGSHMLSDPKGDGAVSEKLYIGVSAITNNDPGDVSVIEVSEAVFLEDHQSSVDQLWARVNAPNRLGTIWIEIKAPAYETIYPVVSDEQSDTVVFGQAEMNLKKIVYHRIERIVLDTRYLWEGLSDFSRPGTYQVFYFAIDDITTHASPLMETLVYKAKSGNNPPSPFQLISPENNVSNEESNTSTALILRWEHTVDPDEDLVTYTALLSEKNKFFFNPIQKSSLSNNSCIFNRSNGIKNFTRYYWKVIAIDQYGAKRESDIWTFYTDDKNNPPWGALEAYVFNKINGQIVNDARVIVGNLTNSQETSKGYYLDFIPPGAYNIIIKAPGYLTKSYPDIEIPRMETLIRNFKLCPEGKKGDLNLDGEVNISDAIFGLKVLAHKEACVHVDMRIVLYVFQEVLK